MPFLTDLWDDDVIELITDNSTIRIQFVKRTGLKVRLSIDAGQEVKIKKIDGKKGRQDAIKRRG